MPDKINVILVNKKDEEIGVEEKLKAHQLGKLHRAFSIFVFNSQGQLMLQKRALAKYHCGGLWSNTCCSHPRPGENLKSAAHRRLKEEMGFDCGLKEIHSFIYKIEFPNKLIEHEYDHILVGGYNNEPIINPEEAEDWQWIDIPSLKKDIDKNPEKYTYWFKIALEKVVKAPLNFPGLSGKF